MKHATQPNQGHPPKRLRRPVGQVIAAALLMLASVALTSAASAAEPSTDDTGWIRAGHLAAGNGSANIRLTPFSGGKTVTVPDVSYGDVTRFRSVPAGLYTVAVVGAGAGESANPMVSASVRVSAGRATSVFAIGEKGDVRSTVISDDLTAPPEGKARVRLLSAVGIDQSVQARLSDGTELARDVADGDSTGYLAVAAQTWSVGIETSSGATATMRVPVEAGGVYTLIAAKKADGKGVRLEAVLDANGASQMPRGGVDTGGGALATAAAASASDHSRLVVWVLGGLGVTLMSLAALAGSRRPGALISQ